jgi:hypothetical protein
MTYRSKSVAATLFKLGRVAGIKSPSTTDVNDFGNSVESMPDTFDREVIAFKTYPNRNTQVEANIGDLDQDRPVFMVPKGDSQPAVPAEGDHIFYDGDEYEVKSHTPYDTHVEFFGEPVIH